ncbi:2-amino-4-hydroxy-6-hydroxymethyldihydropteridinediphosphokinase [soil metagenome]
MTARAFLGLGSNQGDRRRYLRDAIASLGPSVVAVSPVYETDPVGGPGGQERYLNVVVELRTDLTPATLLGVCHRLEGAADRVRDVRWGPRTLDVDILWMHGVALDSTDLTIPHPRMAGRRFVMAPLRDLAPELVPEDWEERAEGAVDRLGPL